MDPSQETQTPPDPNPEPAKPARSGPELHHGTTPAPPTQTGNPDSSPPPQQQAKPQPDDEASSPLLSPSPDAYEQEHVHSVYESIASHFSSTRHKPWPFVHSFLSSLPAGSLGLDVGCGNGKYLALNPNLAMLASDRSAALARLAAPRSRGDVLVADGLALPFRPGAADFAICIAVVHHFSTVERRREAIAALLDCVRPRAGKVLVYVWALEQKASRRGWDEGGEQDLLVPWVMRGNQKKKKGTEGGGGEEGEDKGDETYQRYYHLYRKGELEEDVVAAGGTVLESGYEKDNWWAVCSRP